MSTGIYIADNFLVWQSPDERNEAELSDRDSAARVNRLELEIDQEVPSEVPFDVITEWMELGWVHEATEKELKERESKPPAKLLGITASEDAVYKSLTTHKYGVAKPTT